MSGARGRCGRWATWLAAAVWASCAPSAPGRPPLVLVTVEGLRADAASDALPRSAQAFANCAGCRHSAIATSSATTPALASLLTGLNPWRHRVLLDRQSLGEEFRTLAEALQAAGYDTHGFTEAATTATARRGFAQGFTHWAQLRDGKEAAAALRGMVPGRFVWIHFVAARTYRADPADPSLASLDAAWQKRARRGFRRSLLQEAQDAGRLDAGAAIAASSAYRHSLAPFDRTLGRLLDALAESNAARQTTLVLVGVQGDPLGEGGQWQRGQNLERGSIEVPLWIRTPVGSAPPCAVSTTPPSARTVFAVVLERAGLEPPPGVAAACGEASSTSFAELYRVDGLNRFAWVSEGRLLHWQTRLDPVGSGPRALGRRRNRSYRGLFPFTAPLTGGTVTASVLPWTGSNGQAVPATPAEMARFEAAFLDFVDRQRSPQEELSEVP